MSNGAFRMDEYAVFLPHDLWGETFIQVWGAVGRQFSLHPLEIGEHRAPDTDEIVKSKVDYARSLVGGTTPVFVLPVTTALYYSAARHQSNRLFRIMAPAFKTRDDIFIFFHRRWCDPDLQLARRAALNNERRRTHRPNGEAAERSVAYKGDNVTTTVLARLYSKLAIEEARDPIHHARISDRVFLPWRYKLNIGPAPQGYSDDDEAGGLDGIIASGKEVGDHVVDRSLGKKWYAAVNLNAWICCRYGVPYFSRAVFCTIPEALEDEIHQKRLLQFWHDFVKAGAAWAQKSRQAAHHSCPLGASGLPIQVPAVTEIYLGCEQEIASDLMTAVRFLNEARRYGVADTLRAVAAPLLYEHFEFVNRHAAWAALSKYHPEVVDDFLEKYVVTPEAVGSRVALDDPDIRVRMRRAHSRFRAVCWNRNFALTELPSRVQCAKTLAADLIAKLKDEGITGVKRASVEKAFNFCAETYDAAETVFSLTSGRY